MQYVKKEIPKAIRVKNTVGAGLITLTTLAYLAYLQYDSHQLRDYWYYLLVVPAVGIPLTLSNWFTKSSLEPVEEATGFVTKAEQQASDEEGVFTISAEQRYFVLYRNLRQEGTYRTETYLGRFGNSESAEESGRSKYDVEGYSEFILVRHESKTEAVIYFLTRFFIRSLRVASASVIAIFIYSWLSGSSWIGDVPFSSLTMNMVFSTIFKIVVAIWGFYLSMWLVFGEGPQD